MWENEEGLRTTKTENSIKKQTSKRDRNDPLWEKNGGIKNNKERKLNEETNQQTRQN